MRDHGHSTLRTRLHEMIGAQGKEPGRGDATCAEETGRHFLRLRNGEAA